MSTQVKAWEPTPEQVAYLLRFSKNNEYYIKHMEQLRKAHGGKFIVISQGKVILDDDDAQRLLDLLRENYTETDRSQMYTTYVPLEQEIRIA